MTQDALQKMFRELKDQDASVRMTTSNGKKAIVNNIRTLYEF